MMPPSTKGDNMSKHTPGPWKVAQTGGFELAVYGRSKNQPICIFTTPDGDYIPQELKNGKANAHLIAAAPDLLAALKALSAGLHDELDSNPRVKASEVRAARAAIAKAEGGS
jgi:hypothetical protein